MGRGCCSVPRSSRSDVVCPLVPTRLSAGSRPIIAEVILQAVDRPYPYLKPSCGATRSRRFKVVAEEGPRGYDGIRSEAYVMR
jgi:hypothetical protein